jgi:hypothetical protein
METSRLIKEKRKRCSKALEHEARTLIEKHSHFVGRGCLFEFQLSEGVLIVRGNVPTFYLKQVLQTALKNLDGVRLIDNQVVVGWTDGLIAPTRNFDQSDSELAG